MADDTQNPQALAQAQEALEAANRQAKDDAKIRTTSVILQRPIGIGGVDYAKGAREIPTEALEAEQEFADRLEADGDLAYTSDKAADGAPRATKATGTTTPNRKR